MRLVKVFSTIFVIAFTLSCVFAQNTLNKELLELLPIRENEKWGYINRQGKVVIKPQFKIAMPFSEGLAVACFGFGKCGYINRTGKFVIEPVCS